MDNKYLLSTLAKAKEVIDLVNKEESVTLKETMQSLDLSKSTTFRLLYSLVELDFLVKKDNLYFLKNKFRSTNNPKINWTAVPILKPLVDKYHLSAYIGIIFQNKIVITQVVPAKNHQEDFSRLGESMPLNTTAMGKCALAFLNDDEREKLLKLDIFSRKTKYTLTDNYALKKSLKIIREQGYALDDEEKAINFRCLAVPIMQDSNSVAVMGLSGRLDELKRCDIKKLAHEMKEKSIEIEMKFLE